MDRDKIVIKTEDYEKELKGILPKYGIPGGNLSFPPALPHPDDSESPFTPAQADKDKKEIYILEVLEQIHLDAPLNNIPLDEIGMRRRNILENDNWLFLKHLLLHEVSHVLHPNWTVDAKCDEWAFKEMGL